MTISRRGVYVTSWPVAHARGERDERWEYVVALLAHIHEVQTCACSFDMRGLGLPVAEHRREPEQWVPPTSETGIEHQAWAIYTRSPTTPTQINGLHSINGVPNFVLKIHLSLTSMRKGVNKVRSTLSIDSGWMDCSPYCIDMANMEWGVL